MNVNLQTCDSCFKSETLYLSYCSIKTPLPALSKFHFSSCFLGFNVTSIKKKKKKKKRKKKIKSTSGFSRNIREQEKTQQKTEWCQDLGLIEPWLFGKAKVWLSMSEKLRIKHEICDCVLDLLTLKAVR